MTYRFPIIDGDRVALAPHLDLWMQGIRFGIVVEQSVNEENERRYLVQYTPGDAVWLTGEDLLGAVNAVPGRAEQTGASPSTEEPLDEHGNLVGNKYRRL